MGASAVAGSIGNAGGRGIDGALAADENSNVRLRVHANTITGMRGEGMFFNANNTATLNIQVTNNQIPNTPIVATTFENLQIQAASGTPPTPPTSSPRSRTTPSR